MTTHPRGAVRAAHPRRYRAQRRIPGMIRTPMSTAVTSEIESRIQETMSRFRVSRSYVIAVACAAFLGIDEQDSFDEPRQNGHRNGHRSRRP